MGTAMAVEGKMKNFRVKLLCLLLAALAAGLGAQALAAKKASGLVVVVKAGGALEDLTLKDIRAIYLGEKLFQGSSKIEPLVNGDDSVALVFFGKVLGKTKAQFKKIWKSKAFVDGLESPPILPSSEEVLHTVQKEN